GDIRLRARRGEIDDRLLVRGHPLERRIERNDPVDRELRRVAAAGFSRAFEESEITAEAVADEREVRLRVALFVVTEHLLEHGERLGRSAVRDLAAVVTWQPAAVGRD